MRKQYLKLIVIAILFSTLSGCIAHKVEMMRALDYGDINRVKVALTLGADVNMRIGKLTPLMIASMRGQESIVKLFLERGAEVDATYKDGMTSLMFASAQGHKQVVKLLLSHGANVHAQTGDGRTPLLYAKHNNQSEIVELLKAAGADEGE